MKPLRSFLFLVFNATLFFYIECNVLNRQLQKLCSQLYTDPNAETAIHHSAKIPQPVKAEAVLRATLNYVFFRRLALIWHRIFH